MLLSITFLAWLEKWRRFGVVVNYSPRLKIIPRKDFGAVKITEQVKAMYG